MYDHPAMSQFTVLITIVFCLSFPVKAQDESKADRDSLHPLQPNTAAVIGVLSILFSLLLLVLAYAKFCQANTDDLMNHDSGRQNFEELIRSGPRFSGIDRAVIESLPFFRFASLKGSKEGLECAVCISRFEDTEVLRLLPKCRHAFHLSCIDQWLERHSSCPLCRYKFEARDLRSFSYSTSLRFLGNNPSNLTEDPNVELFVQREQNRPGSSRLNIGSSFQKIDEGKNEEELLIEEGYRNNADQKLLHKFKHRIIISDIFIKNRWSDVNSSDLLFLNSEMLNVMSSNRFSRSNSTSGRLLNRLPGNDNMVKIKEDIERKKLFESKFSEIHRNDSVSASGLGSTSFDGASSSKMLNAVEKRSKSEITNFARFGELSIREKIKEAALGGDFGKEARIRRLWLPIVQRTVQWFTGRERNLQELEHKRHFSNA